MKEFSPLNELHHTTIAKTPCCFRKTTEKWAGMATILPTSPGTPGRAAPILHPLSMSGHVLPETASRAHLKPSQHVTNYLSLAQTHQKGHFKNCSFQKALSDKVSSVQSRCRWRTLQTAHSKKACLYFIALLENSLGNFLGIF